jgi:hypothetical protein
MLSERVESAKDPPDASIVDLPVGDWVLVCYDATSFPGEVKVGDEDVRAWFPPCSISSGLPRKT